MIATATPMGSFAGQVDYCRANDAPITARLAQALADALDDTTATGRAVLGWAGNPVADALPLRLVGGIHWLWRRGAVPALAALFARDGPRERDAAAMRGVLADHDATLLRWLDGPPQTNEPGRCAQLMTGLLEVAARYGPRLELLEIGSSAGLNLLIDRYRIEFPGFATGPAASAVVLRPAWRGPPPPACPPAIVASRGCDIAPLDVGDPDQAERLLAYVWADHAERFARLDKAIALFRADPPRLDAADAADWVEARLTEPQANGVTRVLMHSIVWQYLPASGQARITAAMVQAGARATPERPLAWVRVEADRTVHRHDISLRSWPGDGETAVIGHAHAHGFWVERR
jgi:hypothetical protein